MALFSTHSLRVAAKKAMRGVAKPCRGATPAAFRTLRMAFLIRNASWKNSVNRPWLFRVPEKSFQPPAFSFSALRPTL
ncbi:MAG: hypothetical protein CVU22_09745 [Betaproteobacteria bacterium HGW-Betaproteobacteria-16]|nr:MAG: hypothetical protein CVU22_09745 [Betaproteobacteria bacterium HGW-Betaproteobacteria-16]